MKACIVSLFEGGKQAWENRENTLQVVNPTYFMTFLHCSHFGGQFNWTVFLTSRLSDKQKSDAFKFSTFSLNYFFIYFEGPDNAFGLRKFK